MTGKQPSRHDGGALLAECQHRTGSQQARWHRYSNPEGETALSAMTGSISTLESRVSGEPTDTMAALLFGRGTPGECDRDSAADQRRHRPVSAGLTPGLR